MSPFINEGEICSVCGRSTRGGFDVSERSSNDGVAVIAIDSTPDRDFNVCDLCNDVVHFRCSQHPETGYCDSCYGKMYDAQSRVRLD